MQSECNVIIFFFYFQTFNGLIDLYICLFGVVKRTVHLLDRLNGSGRFELVATGSIIFLPMRQSLFYFTGAE